MNAAIRVENLSKVYRLGRSARASYRTLREALTEPVLETWHRWRRGRASVAVSAPDTLWAIRDVSFVIEPGEVVGIIGRNGAGKSTLLKVLSRITEPSVGRVEMRGRLGSLLKVGTGFHPELTGRENVYLSGAILGMPRRDIHRRFDDIVAFAEVERFLDTPVKRYSSGMYVRLAFAVAAHLEPDILLVDEVLAVGDATYQKRCLDRMKALANSGSTVLFVSHNMDLIPRLCRKGILLEQGAVKTIGPAAAVVEQYLDDPRQVGQDDDVRRRPRSGDGLARFVRARLFDGAGQPRTAHVSGEDLVLRVEIEAQQEVRDVALALVLKTPTGTRLLSSWTREVNHPVDLHPGLQSFDCRFEQVRLRPGQRVGLMLWMEADGVIDSVEDARTIDVIDGPETRAFSTDSAQGLVLCNYHWSRIDPQPREVS